MCIHAIIMIECVHSLNFENFVAIDKWTQKFMMKTSE